MVVNFSARKMWLYELSDYSSIRISLFLKNMGPAATPWICNLRD